MGKKIYKILFNMPEFICSVLLSGIILLNLVGVIMRYIVGKPLTWNEEVTLLMYVWMVMVGSSCMIKRNTSVKLDFLMNRLPDPLHKALLILIAIAAMAFYALLSKLAIELGIVSKNRTGILKVHYFWIYLSIVVGTVFNLWFLALRIVHIVRGERLDLSWSPEAEREQQEVMASMYDAEELKSEVDD